MRETTSAAILCGGKSSRMGFDKSLLLNNGEYHISTIYTAIASRFTKISLVTNQPNKFDSISRLSTVRKIKDYYPEKGPLGAMCTALESIQSDWIFMCACDLSHIDINLIDLLNEEKKGYQVAISKRTAYLETLFAFYHKSCLNEFQRQLENGRGRPVDAFSRLKVKTIEIDKTSDNMVFNLNTKEDLKRWRNSNYFKE